MEKIRPGEGQKLNQSAADNFRSVMRKIQESYNARDPKTAREARQEARIFGAEVVKTFRDSDKRDQGILRDAVRRMTILTPGDEIRDIYYLLLKTKEAPALVVRHLLCIRPHGKLPTSKRAAIY